jgi:hypothetical protein
MTMATEKLEASTQGTRRDRILAILNRTLQQRAQMKTIEGSQRDHCAK